MTAVLLQAVKEQQQTIAGLREEINRMKSEKDDLAELKKEVTELKKQVGFTTLK